MEADRVVVELIAKVDGFDGKVKATTATFENSMGRISTAATKAEKAVAGSSDARIAAIRRESNQISQFSRMLGGQINDVGNLMVGPKSPFVVPVKQAPAVSNAMKLIVTGASAVGSIMGGFLATSVLAGAAALAEFILKSDNAEAKIRELVEALKEDARQTALARRAKEEFGRTIEGLNAALDEQEIALNKIAQADKGVAYQAAIAAEQKRLQAIEIRKATVAALEHAQAQLEVLRVQQAQNGGSLRETGVNAEIAITEQRLKTLRSQLADAQAGLARAEQQAAKALSLAAVERGSETELDAIKRRYDKLVESTRQRLVAEGKVASEIVKQTQALREQQRVEEEAARKRKQKQGDARLPKVTQAEVQALIKDVFGPGTAITSTTRSAARNKAAGGAANSYHLSGQAVDFVPGRGMSAFDKEMLRLAGEARGIKFVELLGPGDKGHSDHGHAAFSRTRLGPDQVAAAQERRAQAEQRLALEAERREQAFQNEMASLEDGVIEARQALVTSAEEIAQLELQAIEISRQKYADNLASLVTQKKLTAEEADELGKLNDERAKLRTELVARREAERRFRLQEADAQRAVQAQLGSRGAQQELLQSQAGLATTAKERHALERKLLTLQFEMERIQNDAIIAEYERLRIKQDLTEAERQELADKQLQAELARERNGTLGERQANANSQNDTSNAGPLGDFFGSIPDTAGEINEALEGIAAGGLQSVTDGLTDAILGFRSFGDVGRAVLQQVLAGLIKLGIQQLLLHTIGTTIGASATAANAALGAATAAAWAPAAAAVSLATFGANAGPASAAMASTYALSSALAAPKGFEVGGWTGSGATNKPAGIVHGQEYVFDAPATRRIGVANLEAMRKGVRPSNARAAQSGGRGGGGGADAAQLQGIVETAIRAMPPVNLFPTYDPVASMEAALNDTRGRRVLLDFMGNNRGAVSGTIAP